VIAAGLSLFLQSTGGSSRPPKPQPLDPPTVLRARGQCDGFFKTRVALQWTPTLSSFADGYVIYRSTSPDGPFRKVELLDGRGRSSYVDPRLDTSARYFYVIRATAGVRQSTYSDPAETSTPAFCL
jgi:hypothetical protein